MRRTVRSRSTVMTIALALVSLLGMRGAAVQAAPGNPVAGQAALEALAGRLPAVARAYGLSSAELQALFEADPTLHVDAGDELLYVDHDYADDGFEAAVDPGALELDSIPVEQTFLLHSLPGAAHTIYLDFDGHTTSGTTWNAAYGVDPIVSPAYDIDNDPSSFNSTEIARIQATWQIVAEDFRPFEVNVTTEDPGAEALRYSGAGDTAWGTRVVITDDTFANCGCGGHAYIGSFDDPQDEPVFVYNTSLTGVAEASSHEVGHALNLSHDGTSTSAYYWGHGSGETSWGPIMGASYNRSVTQWSQGEYFDANNGGSGANYGNGPDDLAVIASLSNGNGFGYRSDDHGADLAGSTALTTAGTSVSGAGIIEGSDDVDAFRFTTGAGQVDLDIQPWTPNRNLDVLARLYDASDTLVATADPSTLAASLSLGLAAGTYYLTIEGTGYGSPLSDPPTGYTDYGSLGQYAISGTIVDPGVFNNPPSFGRDPIIEADATVDQAYGGSLADEASDLDGDALTFSKLGGPAWLDVAANGDLSGTPGASDVGANAWTVQVEDGRGGSDQATLEITVVDPPDFVDFLATGESAVLGTVSGSYLDTAADDGTVQTITEVESGGKPSTRHSELEHRWTFAVQPGTAMTLHANAWADSSSDGDSFELAYATDGSSFVTLGSLSATADEGEQLFALPSDLSGTVTLRLVDSDRTEGNRDLDSVYVDHLYIRSATQLPDPPAAPSNLVATADGATAIDLDWLDGSNDETGFRVERSPDGLTGWVQVAELGIDASSYRDTELSPETSYSYRVAAFNAAGSSAYSNLASATTGVAGSMHVADLAASAVTDRGRWDATVTVTIVDAGGAAVAGATVSGSWSNGANGGGSCVTDAAGRCDITKANLKSNVGSVTFDVDDVQQPAFLYDAGSNVVSSIVVNQP